jgi:hypothetical protein
LNERHLHRLIREYVDYYHHGRRLACLARLKGGHRPGEPARYADGMSYWRIWIPGGLGERRPSGLSGSLWAREEGGTLFEMNHWGEEHHPPVPIDGSVPDVIRGRYGVTAQVAKAKLGAGEYHPRMWRPFYSPRPNTTYESERTMSVQVR